MKKSTYKRLQRKKENKKGTSKPFKKRIYLIDYIFPTFLLLPSIYFLFILKSDTFLLTFLFLLVSILFVLSLIQERKILFRILAPIYAILLFFLISINDIHVGARTGKFLFELLLLPFK